MYISRTDWPALILVDIQKAFDNVEYWGGQRKNPGAEEKAGQLLKIWRGLKLPIFHIKHCSSNPKSLLNVTNEGNEFKDLVRPIGNEPVITKNVNSAFIGTYLKELLENLRITKLVIVGMTTDHCISTTARMAGNFGFETYLVSDATATFNKRGLDGQNYPAELIHATALASLKNNFAQIVTAVFVMRNI